MAVTISFPLNPETGLPYEAAALGIPLDDVENYQLLPGTVVGGDYEANTINVMVASGRTFNGLTFLYHTDIDYYYANPKPTNPLDCFKHSARCFYRKDTSQQVVVLYDAATDTAEYAVVFSFTLGNEPRRRRPTYWPFYVFRLTRGSPWLPDDYYFIWNVAENVAVGGFTEAEFAAWADGADNVTQTPFQSGYIGSGNPSGARAQATMALSQDYGGCDGNPAWIEVVPDQSWIGSCVASATFDATLGPPPYYARIASTEQIPGNAIPGNTENVNPMGNPLEAASFITDVYPYGEPASLRTVRFSWNETWSISGGRQTTITPVSDLLSAGEVSIPSAAINFQYIIHPWGSSFITTGLFENVRFGLFFLGGITFETLNRHYFTEANPGITLDGQCYEDIAPDTPGYWTPRADITEWLKNEVAARLVSDHNVSEASIVVELYYRPFNPLD